jgi:NAD+ diphosphatase
MECGTKLIIMHHEHEGEVPFCPNCNDYRFPIYSSAVSMVVVNKDFTKTLLIKQYGRDLDILVAGYINKGETAEEAVYRELKEEVGLTPISIKFQKSHYWEKSNALLFNFLCVVDDENITPNFEIDSYKWYDLKEAYNIVDKTRLVGKFYCYFYEQNVTK